MTPRAGASRRTAHAAARARATASRGSGSKAGIHECSTGPACSIRCAAISSSPSYRHASTPVRSASSAAHIRGTRSATQAWLEDVVDACSRVLRALPAHERRERRRVRLVPDERAASRPVPGAGPCDRPGSACSRPRVEPRPGRRPATARRPASPVATGPARRRMWSNAYDRRPHARTSSRGVPSESRRRDERLVVGERAPERSADPAAPRWNAKKPAPSASTATRASSRTDPTSGRTTARGTGCRAAGPLLQRAPVGGGLRPELARDGRRRRARREYRAAPARPPPLEPCRLRGGQTGRRQNPMYIIVPPRKAWAVPRRAPSPPPPTPACGR